MLLLLLVLNQRSFLQGKMGAPEKLKIQDSVCSLPTVEKRPKSTFFLIFAPEREGKIGSSVIVHRSSPQPFQS